MYLRTFFFERLYKLFGDDRSKIYLLGGSTEIINKAVDEIKNNYSNLKIAGFYDGYFDLQLESDEIIAKINNSNADVLICGMGMPRTEIWIQENLEKLHVKCIFSVGGFFDFLAKEKKMAPKWFYNSGLEWIFRLIQEPRRLFERYIKSNSYFVTFLIKQKYFSLFSLANKIFKK